MKWYIIGIFAYTGIGVMTMVFTCYFERWNQQKNK